VSRASKCLYWPLMVKEIKDKVNSCYTCLANSRANQKETLTNRELPVNPWQHVAMDIFQLDYKLYLLIVDMYSKFPEVIELPNMTANTIIKETKAIFSRHGVPKIAFADNGTQFVSNEFLQFANQWGFKLQTSSARYSQSNGFIERHVQTIKNLFKKAKSDKKDIMLTLLEYRNTPMNCGSPSPAQLLFNRRIGGLMPRIEKLYKPKIITYNKQLVANQKRQKHYYDRNAKDLKPLCEGDKVVLQTGTRMWEPGTIVNKLERPRSYQVQLNSGSTLERNRRFLQKDMSIDTPRLLRSDRSIDLPNVLARHAEVVNPANEDKPIGGDSAVSAPSEPVDTEGQLRRSTRTTKAPPRLDITWKGRCYDVGNI